MKSDTKTTITAVAIAVLVVIALRFITPEDNWVCDHGQWVKHGNPSAAMPTKPCK